MSPKTHECWVASLLSFLSCSFLAYFQVTWSSCRDLQPLLEFAWGGTGRKGVYIKKTRVLDAVCLQVYICSLLSRDTSWCLRAPSGAKTTQLIHGHTLAKAINQSWVRVALARRAHSERLDIWSCLNQGGWGVSDTVWLDFVSHKAKNPLKMSQLFIPAFPSDNSRVCVAFCLGFSCPRVQRGKLPPACRGGFHPLPCTHFTHGLDSQVLQSLDNNPRALCSFITLFTCQIHFKCKSP